MIEILLDLQKGAHATSIRGLEEPRCGDSRWHRVQRRGHPRAITIDCLTAGKRDDDYLAKVDAFDLHKMYSEWGGNRIEAVREQWIESYDFILIDSRTGFSDFGGLCTIHLPDVLVTVFTPMQQSLTGIRDVAVKVRERQAIARLPGKSACAAATESRRIQREGKD